MVQDIRFALRALRRHPTSTALTLLTLGLAIGATVAVFSVVEAVLLRPLPLPDPDRLVALYQRTVGSPTGRLSTPRLEVPELRGETDIFEGVGVRGLGVGDVTFQAGSGAPQHAVVLTVSYDYLSVLGVQPILGRTFTREDAVAASAGDSGEEDSRGIAVVLTYGLWQRAFGSDPGVLDRTLSIMGQPAYVVGVLPSDFGARNKRRHGWVAGKTADFFNAWPERYFTYPGPRPGSRGILPTARLKPGVTYDEARAALEVLASRLRSDYPGYAQEDMHYVVTPLEEEWRASYRPVLLVLAGGVVFLLLLVCANLANLTLVRGWTRAGEDAVRSAVGCGRARLVGQKLLESLLVAVGGSVVGLGVAWAAIRVLGAVAPGNVPVLHQVGMNVRVVAAGVAVAAILVAFFVLISGAQGRRQDLVQVLNSEGRGAGGSRRRRVMNELVVVELVLSMVLLSGAAIMVRSLFAMTGASPGFQPEEALTFEGRPYSEESRRSLEARAALYERIEQTLSALPGVEVVGRSSMLPFSGGVWNAVYAPDPEGVAKSAERADYIVVTDDYFQAMGTRLLGGRFFTPAEMEDSTSSIIVDEKLAGIAWPGQDPIGKRLYFDWEEGWDVGTVVGVVEHMLMTDFGSESREALFFPMGRIPWRIPGGFVLRTALPAERLAGSVRRTLLDVDPTFVPYGLQKLSDRVALSVAPTRFVVMTMTAFAILALLVAVVGLFGVISYAVRTRTTELGIRMALGAGKHEILTMVLRQGALLGAAGIAGGVVGAIVLARFMKSMVFEASPTDPLLLSAMALVLAAVSLLACWAPARWACRVDPARVLAGPRV